MSVFNNISNLPIPTIAADIKSSDLVPFSTIENYINNELIGNIDRNSGGVGLDGGYIGNKAIESRSMNLTLGRDSFGGSGTQTVTSSPSTLKTFQITSIVAGQWIEINGKTGWTYISGQPNVTMWTDVFITGGGVSNLKINYWGSAGTSPKMFLPSNSTDASEVFGAMYQLGAAGLYTIEIKGQTISGSARVVNAGSGYNYKLI